MEPPAPLAAVNPVAPSPASLQYAVPVTEAQGTCYRCGYALRGIADDQPCPECGLLAERSRRVSDELHDTRPRWLARIARGSNLVLLAILMVLSMPFVVRLLMAFTEQVYGRFVGPPAGITWYRLSMMAPLFVLDLAAAVLLIAAFMLTSPEGYAPADEADRRLRRALRLAAMVPLVALALFHVYTEMSLAAFTVPSWTAGFGLSAIGFAAAALGTVGTAPLPLLLFRQLRGLAKRARSAHLAEHCTIVGVGAAMSFVYCGVFSFIAAYGGSLGLSPYWTNRSNLWLGMMLLLSVLAFLFLLWSLYLLIRFAVALNRAARQLRGKWSEADRATVPGLA